MPRKKQKPSGPQRKYDDATYDLMLRAETSKGSTRLRAERLARGYLQKDVAGAVGTNAANLLRIEAGLQTPKQDLARKLYDFYEGVVPLGACYDPIFARARALDGLAGAAAEAD